MEATPSPSHPRPSCTSHDISGCFECDAKSIRVCPWCRQHPSWRGQNAGIWWCSQHGRSPLCFVFPIGFGVHHPGAV